MKDYIPGSAFLQSPNQVELSCPENVIRSISISFYSIPSHVHIKIHSIGPTVDGKNPAPVDMQNITCIYTCFVVFHR